MAIRIPISVRSWVCSHPNIHTCMILFVSLGVFSLCMFRERKHGSLNRGNCLVGITGLEPGAIERVRSPPRLRSHWDCGGTQSPTSTHKVCIVSFASYTGNQPRYTMNPGGHKDNFESSTLRAFSDVYFHFLPRLVSSSNSPLRTLKIHP